MASMFGGTKRKSWVWGLWRWWSLWNSHEDLQAQVWGLRGSLNAKGGMRWPRKVGGRGLGTRSGSPSSWSPSMLWPCLSSHLCIPGASTGPGPEELLREYLLKGQSK